MPHRFKNQRGAGSSDYSGLFHSWSADPAQLSRFTLKHIDQAPMFHPLDPNTVIPTGTSGIIPTGTYYDAIAPANLQNSLGPPTPRAVQMGGKKNVGLKALAGKIATKKTKLQAKGHKLPKDRSVLGSLRTFKAIVNGKAVGHYFKGSPVAAARKVVAKVGGSSDKPVPIHLTEVTRGVYKYRRPRKVLEKLERYQYYFWGYTKKLAKPHTITRGGKKIVIHKKNIAYPASTSDGKMLTFIAAKKLHTKRSNKAKKVKKVATKKVVA
jgi:hypothetical protein